MGDNREREGERERPRNYLISWADKERELNCRGNMFCNLKKGRKNAVVFVLVV